LIHDEVAAIASPLRALGSHSLIHRCPSRAVLDRRAQLRARKLAAWRDSLRTLGAPFEFCANKMIKTQIATI
jgi:hypothetical protein